MKLDHLPGETLTVIGGSGRHGDQAMYAVAAGWARKVLDQKGARVAVVSPDAMATNFWLGLAGVQSYGSHGDRLLRWSGEPDRWHLPPSALAGQAGAAIRDHGADVVIVVDHHAPDAAAWAWLTKAAKAERVIVLSSSPSPSTLRLFPVDSELPTLMRCRLVSDNATAHELTVQGTSWKPDELNDAFDSDRPTSAAWSWSTSTFDADEASREWVEAAEEARTEAERADARAYLARFGLTPSLAELPTALRTAAPWLAHNQQTGK